MRITKRDKNSIEVYDIIVEYKSNTETDHKNPRLGGRAMFSWWASSLISR